MVNSEGINDQVNSERVDAQQWGDQWSTLLTVDPALLQ